MKKKIIIIVSVVLVLIIGFLIWWNVPKKLCDIDAQKVEKITIFKTWFQEEIEVTDEKTIAELVEKFNSVKMKHCRYAPNTFGYVYIVTIQTESETQMFTIDVNGVSGKVLNYLVIEGDTGFYYIDDMFQKFYD